MYYTGLDLDLKPVYVCRNPHEKAMQRALIQYRNPKNYDLVYEALTRAGRTDLIGYDKKCLIRPKKAGQGDKRRNVPQGNAVKERDRTSKGNVKRKTIRNIHKKKGG